jgi:hypothetical protein
MGRGVGSRVGGSGRRWLRSAIKAGPSCAPLGSWLDCAARRAASAFKLPHSEQRSAVLAGLPGLARSGSGSGAVDLLKLIQASRPRRRAGPAGAPRPGLGCRCEHRRRGAAEHRRRRRPPRRAGGLGVNWARPPARSHGAGCWRAVLSGHARQGACQCSESPAALGPGSGRARFGVSD